MLNFFIIFFGKIISKFIQLLNLGNGSTWPGHIALGINKNFIREMLSDSALQIILIAGTNGKTTTGKLIHTVLEENGKKVIQNQSGANLLNGIASTLLLHADLNGKIYIPQMNLRKYNSFQAALSIFQIANQQKVSIHADFAIFEVDENALPLALKEIVPHYILLLNLFRDQLDRYGEVHSIAKKWKLALEKLPSSTVLILNADDPQIAFLGKDIKADTLFFGLDDSNKNNTSPQHAVDSTYCPNCRTKLDYKKIFFSHLGDYACKKCNFRRPKLTIDQAPYPLPGLYNRYNSLAAALTTKTIGISEDKIVSALRTFTPAFGRQEVLVYKDKRIQFFLSKNPTSFNQSYTTIKELGAKTLLLVLNDRIPDGRDISWIWDVDLSGIEDFKQIIISGDRLYDMALRVKYEGYKKFKTHENLEEAVNTGIDLVGKDETLFILPTYSAMLEVRKIITGKKIL